MTCKHTITRGREGQNGSWCIECGEKILGVDERECQNCTYAEKLLVGGWICNKKLMSILPDMHVTFKISEGSCFEPYNKE
jgi:hypothetical protein